MADRLPPHLNEVSSYCLHATTETKAGLEVNPNVFFKSVQGILQNATELAPLK